MGDMSRRRAQLNGTEMKAVNVAVAADVPLAEMFGYATAIRSLSKGRACLHDGAQPFRAGARQRLGRGARPEDDASKSRPVT